MRKILETLKSKWAEYLLEILVITIGILGAFMLNNWNEDRKDRIKEKEILVNLVENFELNVATLKLDIERLREFNVSSRIILKVHLRPYPCFSPLVCGTQTIS